jgi:predicted nuclease of predicted toxin-antitoxin system
MQAADDNDVMTRAAAEERVIVSADTDFGTLLAQRMSQTPSCILFRRNLSHRPPDQLRTLLSNLSTIESALTAGAIVILEHQRIRVRSLPLS